MRVVNNRPRKAYTASPKPPRQPRHKSPLTMSKSGKAGRSRSKGPRVVTSSMYSSNPRPKAKTARANKSKNKGFRRGKGDKHQMKVAGVDVDTCFCQDSALHACEWLWIWFQRKNGNICISINLPCEQAYSQEKFGSRTSFSSRNNPHLHTHSY